MALRRRIAKRPWIPSFNVDPILRQGADSAVHELLLSLLAQGSRKTLLVSYAK